MMQDSQMLDLFPLVFRYLPLMDAIQGLAGSSKYMRKIVLDHLHLFEKARPHEDAYNEKMLNAKHILPAFVLDYENLQKITKTTRSLRDLDGACAFSFLINSETMNNCMYKFKSPNHRFHLELFEDMIVFGMVRKIPPLQLESLRIIGHHRQCDRECVCSKMNVNMHLRLDFNWIEYRNLETLELTDDYLRHMTRFPTRLRHLKVMCIHCIIEKVPQMLARLETAVVACSDIDESSVQKLFCSSPYVDQVSITVVNPCVFRLSMFDSFTAKLNLTLNHGQDHYNCVKHHYDILKNPVNLQAKAVCLGMNMYNDRIRPIADVPYEYFDTICLPNCVHFELAISGSSTKDCRPLTSLVSYMDMPKLTHLKISPYFWSFVHNGNFFVTNHALLSRLTHLDTGKLILPRIYGLPNLTDLSICVPSTNVFHSVYGYYHLPLFLGLCSLTRLRVCVDMVISATTMYPLRRFESSGSQLTDKSMFIPESVQSLCIECKKSSMDYGFDSDHASFPWIHGLDVDSLSTSLHNNEETSPIYLPSRQLEISVRHGHIYPRIFCPNVTKLTIIWVTGNGMQSPPVEISGSNKSETARDVQRTLKNLFVSPVIILRHLKMTSSLSLWISCKFLKEIPMFANVEILEVPRFTKIMDNCGMKIIRF
jgi:hypothetical protein